MGSNGQKWKGHDTEPSFPGNFSFGALCLVGWIIWKESKRYSKARTLYCVYKEVWTSTACIITCSNSLNMIIIAREPDQTRPDWKSKQVCQISVKVSLRACDTVLPCTANKPRLKLEDGVTWVSCERQLIDDFWQNWRGKRLEQGCLQRNKDIYLIDVKNNKMFKSFLNKKN